MSQFLSRKLLSAIATTLLAITLVFVVLQWLPGDAAQSGLGQSAVSPDVIARRRAELGLDLPLWQQYGKYLQNLFAGNLGTSWMGDQPVNDLIIQNLPASVELTVTGMCVALMVGLSLGIFSVYTQERSLVIVIRLLVAFLLSVPTMITGTLLVLGFAVVLGWLPATGQGDLRHLVLPGLVIGISAGASIARAIETEVGEIKHSPFMLYSRAKGLSRWQSLWRHGLRAGLLPVLEVITLQVGYFFTGAVVTENLFARQGLGRLMVIGILNKDLPVVLAVVIVSVSAYSLLHFFTDIAYAMLDPRVLASD